MKSNTGVSNNLALLFAIFFLIAGFGHVEAQDVTFTFPEVVTGEPGDQFSVDVITSDLTGLGVFNFDMEISYDSSLLTITTDEISGGDLLDGSVTANVADDERILVNYASSQEIEGGGTLFTISGKLADEGYNSEGLKVAYVLLGDGSLDVSPSVPVDIVVDVKIEPVWEVYPQLIELSGPEAGTAEFGITQTAGNEDLTWELTSNVGWLSFPDGTTGTGSASVAIGIEENTEAAAREGVITIVTNAGNDQVTVIQPGQPGEVVLDFGGTISGMVGDPFAMDVTVSDLTDLGVSNFEMEMSFDSSLLTITDEDIQGGDLLGGPLTVNVTGDERILVSYASSQDLEGSGKLFAISGTLAGAGENSEGLKVKDLLIGDGSVNVTPSVPVNIAVEVIPEPIEWELSKQLIDLSGPEATTDEFGITQTAGTEPLTWELSSSADWLSFPDGTTGTGSASVALAIEENTQAASREGVITITTNAGTDQVTVTQPAAIPVGEVSLDFGSQISGQVGESFSRDIMVSDLTDLGVSNFDMEYAYDTSLLEIDKEDIEAGGLLDGPVTANVTDDGRILVSYASSQDIEGSGTLFTVSGTLAAGGENPEGLKVTDFLIGDGSVNVSPSVPVNIAVYVDDPEREVTLDFGGPISGTVGERFEVDVTANDLTDLGVSNFDVEYAYDRSLLEIDKEDIEAGGLLDGPVTANVTDDGRILVGYASSQDIEGSGTLFTVSGTLSGEGENPEGLRVIDLLIGDGSLEVTPAVPIDITVAVEPPPEDSLEVSPSELSFEAAGGSQSLEVTSNLDSWTVTSDADWITISGASGSGDDAEVIVSVSENNSTTTRSGIITVNGGTLTSTISVTQELREPQPVTWENFGYTGFSVNRNADWEAVVDSVFGADYSVADWNDLVDYHEDGNDILQLFDSLTIEEYGQSVFVTRNGDKKYSDSRWYFATRHEGNKPGSYLAHENIDNFTISLGSWDGDRPLLAIKEKSDLPDLMPVINEMSVTTSEGSQYLLYYEYEIRNIGPGESESFDTHVYLSSDEVFDDEDSLLKSKSETPLSASSNRVVADNVVIPADLVAGDYSLIIYVDRMNSIEETDDGNNIDVYTPVSVSIEEPSDIPIDFSLSQNYPNPFNPSTQIQYSLPEQAHVTLEIYTMLGERVGLLVNEMKSPGIHEMAFDASNLSSGVYLYRLQTESYIETRQMILIK